MLSYLRDLVSTVHHFQQEAALRDRYSAPTEVPQSLIAPDQGPFDNEETVQQRIAQPESVPVSIEEFVPSVQNPLTSSESFFMVDSSGRQREIGHSAQHLTLLTEFAGYLGPSSSLSFSWQIRYFLQKTIGDDVPINLVPDSEEETYSMASSSVRASLPLTNDELPSREYAKYLAETTLFHLGETHHIFEKKGFMLKMNEFYDNDFCNQPLNTLWHVQLLLVIAFGKLFLRRGASSLGPPGATDFLRALKLQTDILNIWEDPILRIEVLCLMSLYLQTADMRGTAYAFVSVRYSPRIWLLL